MGFGEDLRAYGDSAGMLRALGITEVELITNNPDKAQQLQAHGIRVARVHATMVHVNAHNLAYLTAKKRQHFHTLNLDGLVPNPPTITPFQTLEETTCP